MRRKRPIAVLGLAGAAVVVLSVLAEPTQAQVFTISGVDIEAQLPAGGVHQGEVFSVVFEMSNTTSLVYTAVSFEPSDACSPSTAEGLVAFFELAGNGDAAFGPGEVWQYEAPKCIDSAVPFVGVDVSMLDPTSQVVTGYYSFEYFPLSPIAVSSIGDVVPISCQPSQYTLDVTSVTTTPLVLDWGRFEYAVAGATYPGRIVGSTTATNIEEFAGNGDSLLDPGETWRVSFTVDYPCTVVENTSYDLYFSAGGTTIDVSGPTWCLGNYSICPAHPNTSIYIGTAESFLDKRYWKLTGFITDEVTGKPLTGVFMILVNAVTGAPVDEWDYLALMFHDRPGVFYIDSALSGEFLFCFAASGFEPECWDDHPSDVPGGQYVGDVVFLSGGDRIEGWQVALTPTVAGGDGELPFTGIALPGLLILSLLLLAVGMATVATFRYQRPTDP